MPESTGTPWTTHELEAVVADYLEMLQTELAGGTVVKAERNRALQGSIGRSHGSIEYRHQNISAVMVELGLPFIRGYKPASHYPAILYEVVRAHLFRQALYDSLVSAGSGIIVPPGGLIYEPAPVMNDKLETSNPFIGRIDHELDPAARDAGDRELGEAGEKFVLQAEQEWLSANGRDDLATRVRWVAKEDGARAGYDILSFTEGDEERWLEVKTTNGPATTPFWISQNELKVSEKHQDIFRLIRLYNFSQKPKAYRLRSPLASHVRLVPVQYRAGF